MQLSSRIAMRQPKAQQLVNTSIRFIGARLARRRARARHGRARLSTGVADEFSRSPAACRLASLHRTFSRTTYVRRRYRRSAASALAPAGVSLGDRLTDRRDRSACGPASDGGLLTSGTREDTKRRMQDQGRGPVAARNLPPASRPDDGSAVELGRARRARTATSPRMGRDIL